MDKATTTTLVLEENYTIDMAWEKYREFVSQYRTVEPVQKPFLKTKHNVEEAVDYAEKLRAYEEFKKAEKEEQIANKDIVSKALCVFEEFIKDKAGFYDVPEQYREKVLSKAWSDGHSHGYTSVYNHLCELVEIFQ